MKLLKNIRLPLAVTAVAASTVRAGEDLGPFVLHHVANGHEWRVTPWGPTFHLPTGWKIFG